MTTERTQDGMIGSADPRIAFRSGDAPGACYASGRTVYDEIFRAGRLLSRYWNPNGQIWPDMHFGRLTWSADQPADAFHLEINKRNLAGGYVWTSATVTPDPSAYRVRVDGQGRPSTVVHGVVGLTHAEAGIAVKVHTRLDGGPFLIRWLEITNTGSVAAGITDVAPFSGLLWTHRYEEHLAPSAPSPFELAYNHQFEWGREGDFWFEPLVGGVKTVNGGKKGRSGWGRPAFWARNRCNGETFVCELAWGGNYEFELDCRLAGTGYGSTKLVPAERQAELFFRMGLSGHDDVLRVLVPGETIATPAVHVALFHDDTDAIVQATHEHVRHVVMPPQVPGRHVEIEANHRGYLCDRENVPDILKDIEVAAAVGCEMYVIDAGWYGKDPNQWGNNVGDWHDGPWMHSGGGLAHAHKQGMRFGLWVEIEAAGANSELRSAHPDWLLKRNGEPIANGRALDLTQPDVLDFAERTIERLIGDLKLDMYRIDHNHFLAPSGNRVFHGFTEDLTWRYYENLYGMFERLRAKFPAVVFQNCAGGGGRLDWGTLSRFHNTELSDWMRMPRGLKILNGVTMSLPPDILLRTFGTEVGEHVLDGDVDTQLRHCLCRPIFRGIAPSPEELSPYLRDRIVHFVGVYKDFIRPLMINGRVFHHTPFLPLADKTPWCVLEYARFDRGAALGAVFRTTDEQGAEYTFRARGLDPELDYQVVLDSGGLRWTAPGWVLMQDGVRVRLEQTQTSELLLIRAARQVAATGNEASTDK